MELKDFRRVKLAKGETKTVDFTLQASKLAFYNNDMDWVVEAGDYKSWSADRPWKRIYSILT